MKIIVSSKHLAQQLSNISLDGEWVNWAKLENNVLSLITNKNKIDINVRIFESASATSIRQDGRWDWIYQVVSKIPEQPIVLIINEKNIKIEICC